MQGRYGDAEPLFEQCQAIQEKVLGPEHLMLAMTLDNRAELYKAQVRADRGLGVVVCRHVNGRV